MQNDQYTPDAICESMGIGPFIDPTWRSASKILRLLLKPSFYPEVCITMVAREDSAKLTVVALSETFWHQVQPCPVPGYLESAQIDNSDIVQLIEAYEPLDNHDPQSISLDGMGMNLAWTSSKGVRQLESHVSGNELDTFVLDVIDFVWRTSEHPGVRNGLAHCARFVGRDYPFDPEPPTPKIFRIGVLGSPEDVSDFNEQINRGRGI